MRPPLHHKRSSHTPLPCRLLRTELAKVWCSHIFLLLLAGLLCDNLFLLWVVTNPLQGAYSSHAYRTLNSKLAELSMEEKRAFLNEEYRKIEGLAVVDGVLRMEAYNGGVKDADSRERYAAELAELAEFSDLYKSKAYLTYNDTLVKEYQFLQKCKPNAKPWLAMWCTGVAQHFASHGHSAARLRPWRIFRAYLQHVRV